MLIDGLEYWRGVDYCDFSIWSLFHIYSVYSAYAVHVRYVCVADAARTHCAFTQDAFAIRSNTTFMCHGNMPADDNEEITSLPSSSAFQTTT